MKTQQTACPRFLVMAGADPKDKGIHDSQWGHYGVTFAKVSFADEYGHMPEYGAKIAAEYAERVAAALNACEGIPVEVLKANAAGGLPYSVADQIDARVQRDELLAACEALLDDLGAPDDGCEANLMARCHSVIAKLAIPHRKQEQSTCPNGTLNTSKSLPDAVGLGATQMLGTGSAAPEARVSPTAEAGAVHVGMTIAGNGASMLGKLMRDQHASRGGVYPDGNPNAGSAA